MELLILYEIWAGARVWDSFPGHKRRRPAQYHEGFIPAQARTGVG